MSNDGNIDRCSVLHSFNAAERSQVMTTREDGEESIDYQGSTFEGQYVQYKHKDLMWTAFADTLIQVVVMEMEIIQITVTHREIRNVLSK